MAVERGAGHESPTPPADAASLKAEQLLLAEFSRAGENAQQVRQERATMLGHYLAVVGAVFGAVTALSTIFELFKNQQLLKLSLFGLFLVFGFASVSFFDRELGLNLEWRESLFRRCSPVQPFADLLQLVVPSSHGQEKLSD